MSNAAVGNLYHGIIDEVINSSRVDFEEGGVEESVLEELRRGWQLKLTQLGVASFPWDPKVDPPAAPPTPAPAPSSLSTPAPAHSQYSQAQLTPQLPAGGMALPNGPGLLNQDPSVKPEPIVVKAEPSLPNPSIAAPQYGAANRATEAALRAQQNLQASFGSRAANSINAINAGIPRAQAPGQQPGNAAQFRPGGQVPQGVPNVQAAQTDGAGDDDADYEGVLMQRSAAGTLHEMGRVEIDRVLHAQMAAKAQSMEGGGLMLPLKEATRRRTAPASTSAATVPGGISNVDGGLDDEEVDEDAINSDLDDPDEQASDDDDDDEALQHVMLCMYDKVQRVKNKWKCVLKDGVLTVNGKEYVFHKATGEYEW